MRPKARMLIAAITAITAPILPTAAADGDIYRCLVSDFRYGGPDFSEDLAFAQANRRKTFDIFDLGTKFTVVTNTPDFSPATEDYVITKREMLGDQAAAESTISSETMVLYAPPKTANDQRVRATLVGQRSSGVNIWYLTCVRAN